jgi:Protein of unknown function DUF262
MGSAMAQTQTPRMTVKPEVVLLEDLLAEVREGRLRVPRFQRPFVWRPEQMTALFDSIERGYPVGSLLIWETSEPLRSYDKVADIGIPPAAQSSPVAYLLDGHQRISTLFGALSRRQPLAAYGPDDDWQWRVYRTLGEGDGDTGRFLHFRKGTPPTHYLPMSAVLRTMDFLAYSRTLVDSGVGRLIEEAEEVAQRIKSCQLAVVRLRGGSLNQAVEVFSRVNSTGQPMTPEQMVSALTYDDNDDSLAERIDSIREDLAESGYGTVAPTTVFRTVLAVRGELDVMRSAWDVMAKSVRGDLAESVASTERALNHAVHFLKTDVGVPLGRLVPYQHQIMLLATYFNIDPEPTRRRKDELTSWFWGTSWSGFFAGANSTGIKDSLDQMRRFARGEAAQPWKPEQARSLPQRYTLASARIKAFLIWDLNHFQRRLNWAGEPIKPAEILAASDWRAYRTVVAGADAPNPANRLIFPTPSRTSVLTALVTLPSNIRPMVLESHGISDSAYAALQAGNSSNFVAERSKTLIAAEHEFMKSMRIQLPAEGDKGDDLFDSE